MADLPPLLRQWTLLQMLSARRHGMTVCEMAQETGVSEKTIRRDLQTLGHVGFPLTETVGAHGRKHWRAENHDSSPQLSFNLTEAASLYLGRSLMEPLAGTLLWDGAQSAFAKIRSRLGEPALRYLKKMAAEFHHTVVGAGDYSQRAELIDALMVGIEDRKIAFIEYQSMRATEPVTFDVYPYGLVYHRGSLYLVAFAPEHREIRHYKVDRIGQVELQQMQFVKPDNFDLKQHLSDSFGVFRGKGQGHRIVVRFLPPVARYVQESRWHPSQKLKPARDGSLLAEFQLADTEEIKSWVLSFGQNAVVLEPDNLRREIVRDLRNLIDVYCETRTSAVQSRRERKPKTRDNQRSKR